MNSPAQPSQPKQETKKATIDELWGSSFTNTTNTAKKKESFDAFGDFFKKTDEKPLPVNNNFE